MCSDTIRKEPPLHGHPGPNAGHRRPHRGAPRETLPNPSALDEPWRTIYRRAARAADRADAEVIVSRATRGLEDRHPLTGDLVDLLPGDDAFCIYPSLHEMAGQFSAVDRLWPSWIPRGQLTLQGAAPGVGKSLVALDLARRIFHGRPFPDGAPVPCPGSNVLIVDAEGSAALLNQRARAWDIDRRRLYLMLAPNAGGLIDLDHLEQQLRLGRMCRHIRPALAVVDSLAAAIARHGRLALLLIHYLRKRSRSGPAVTATRVADDDLRGSSHISAAARSVLALSLVSPPPPAPSPPDAHPAVSVPDPSTLNLNLSPNLNPDVRRLEVVKTNLCRHPPPLGLIFEGADVAVPTLRYVELDEASHQLPSPPGQADLCARWLLQCLAEAGEPLRPADVVRAARQAGFSRTTLYRARRALADQVIDHGHSPHDPHKRWSLTPAVS